jgi:hypothetical protein
LQLQPLPLQTSPVTQVCPSQRQRPKLLHCALPPGPQDAAPLQRQRPASQEKLLGQATPQLPQFAGSVRTSVHPEAQAVSPFAQPPPPPVPPALVPPPPFAAPPAELVPASPKV